MEVLDENLRLAVSARPQLGQSVSDVRHVFSKARAATLVPLSTPGRRHCIQPNSRSFVRWRGLNQKRGMRKTERGRRWRRREKEVKWGMGIKKRNTTMPCLFITHCKPLIGNLCYTDTGRSSIVQYPGGAEMSGIVS